SKKPKTPKKKKRKDPNEPVKPVSAYALFFRDTQANIKAQNPNATFGEVSKIVASMWDGLGEEQKQVHPQNCARFQLLRHFPNFSKSDHGFTLRCFNGVMRRASIKVTQETLPD
uniref:HMG box domain-containing protein n=1 Tax=Oryzias sinensis TaxID=183150 RepID=A0A8C7Y4K1_9TELE